MAWIEVFDGRETAPAAADEKLFPIAEGKPMAFYDTVVGGRAVGTPGAIHGGQGAAAPDEFRPARTGGPTPPADFLHLYTEAARLAFADRAQYLSDPDFLQPPAGNWEA